MDSNQIISLVSLLIAIIAFFVAFSSVRFQIVTLINSQLADRAKMCNEQLTDSNKSYIPKENDKVSGILSSIITAEEILNSYLSSKNFFLWKIDSQIIIDHFYLQLHTTVRLFVEKEKLTEKDVNNENQLIIFNQQLDRVKIFLQNSIHKSQMNKY